MKIVKTASGKQTVKLSKAEWKNIGKKAGWMKIAYDENDLYRRYVKVKFDDGDVVSTWINGTEEDIKDYYIGKSFTKNNESKHKAVSVEFIK